MLFNNSNIEKKNIQRAFTFHSCLQISAHIQSLKDADGRCCNIPKKREKKKKKLENFIETQKNNFVFVSFFNDVK